MRRVRLVCWLSVLSFALAGCGGLSGPPQASQATAPAAPPTAVSSTAPAAPTSAPVAPTSAPAAPLPSGAGQPTAPAASGNSAGFQDVLELSLSPTGNALVLETDGAVGLLSLPDRRLLYSQVRWFGQGAVFSPDGSIVVLGTPEKAANGRPLMELRRAADGSLIGTIEGIVPRFSPDGQTVATLDGISACVVWEGRSLLWRAGDGQRIAELEGLNPAFSADSQFVATEVSSQPGSGVPVRLKVFRATGGAAVGQLDAGSNYSFQFHPKQPILIVKTGPSTPGSWQVQGIQVPAMTKLWSLDSSQSGLTSLAQVDISPDGATLALRDTRAGTELWAFTAPELLGRRAQIPGSYEGWFSGDAQRWYAISAAQRDTLLVWDVAGGKQTATLPGVLRVPTASGSLPGSKDYSSFSGDGEVVLADSFEDGSGGRLFAAKDGKVLLEVPQMARGALSRDGRTAALADAAGVVTLVDVAAGQTAALDAAAYPQLLRASPDLTRRDPPAEGALVRYVQERLGLYGYPTDEDGRYGAKTEAGVRAFQQDWDLAADGVVGPATWAALRELPVLRLSDPPMDQPVVRTLQKALKNQGFDVAEDGVFGAQTEAAVRAFQQARSISVDGVVGKLTWQNLLHIAGGGEC
jgi:peptidoglycan hydrolase-like protein with peptidoglycan-binding domain